MPIINIKVMSTIAAFEKEIAMQLDFLKRFVPQKQLSGIQQRKAIFCGTGDSFASALLAEVFSNFQARAHDPLDLVKNMKLVKGGDLYVVSISGNTISNIRLAKRSKKTTAITANPQSRLAEACNKILPLKFRSTGIVTSGSISFLASALTCVSLVSRCKIHNPSKLYGKAQEVAKKVNLHGSVYVLGNLHTYPIAMFCAAKLYEVLGTNAHYERIEQFSHMGLFSCHSGDTVIIFEDENLYNKKLIKHLKDCGLRTIRISIPSKNILEKVLFLIFVSELIALYLAKRKKMKKCYFIQAKKLRNASSAMIY